MTLNSTHTSTPLPEQKLLVCILDKLQKYAFFLYPIFRQLHIFPFLFLCLIYLWACWGREDTYGAFSKPVDTNEVGD